MGWPKDASKHVAIIRGGGVMIGCDSVGAIVLSRGMNTHLKCDNQLGGAREGCWAAGLQASAEAPKECSCRIWA